MRREFTRTALALVASLALAPCAMAAQESPVTPGQQQGVEAQQGEQSGMPGGQQQVQAQALTGADTLRGAQVRSLEGETIGSVDQLIIDTTEGRLAYVVLSATDSGDQMVVPWSALQTQQGQQMQQGLAAAAPVLTVIVPREQMRQAPKGDLQTVLDREQGRQIHQFYGVSPYWEDQSQSPQMIIEPAPTLPPEHPPVLPPGHPPVTPGQQMPPQGEVR